MIRPITCRDRDWVLEHHRQIYVIGHGFDASFEVLVETILDDFFASCDSRYEAGWVAEAHGERLGAVFCTRINATEAQLRLFFLVEAARGQGLGRRLMNRVVTFAKDSGYAVLKLWTHESHYAACRLYDASGWSCIEKTPTVSFGKAEVVRAYIYRF